MELVLSKNKILRYFEKLSPERQQEAIDFLEFLNEKENEYDTVDVTADIIQGLKEVAEGKGKPARELLNEL